MKTKNMCKVIEKFLTAHEHFETIELAKEIESQLKADFIEQDYIHRGEKTTERDYYYYTNGAQAREAEIEALKAENAKLTEQLKNSVVLPCKVGDTVYWLYTEGATGWSNAIKKCQVSKISISSHYTEIHSERTSLNDMNLWGIMGKDVFLLEDEAIARLAELKELQK